KVVSISGTEIQSRPEPIDKRQLPNPQGVRMKEQPSEERPPYDVLCEAVEDYILAMYQRATPESVPPMIAALAEIRTAVEAGIDELLDTGQLSSQGFSTIWMMGT